MRLPGKSDRWFLAAAAAGYLFFSFVYLELPGLEHDEMNFVNAALGNKNNTFVNWSVRLGSVKIPVMIMPYIGAVKSYVYAPIFALFGTGPRVARVPVVFFGLVTLVFTWRYVRLLLGARVARWSCVLLATDPSFIFANRLDWGPISLMMVCKSAVLVLLAKWLNGAGPATLLLATVIAGIGLFDKIVFAWFLGALTLALPICYWGRIRPRLTAKAAAGAMACFLAGCAPLIAYNVRFPLVTFKGHPGVPDDWKQALFHRYDLMRGTFNGDAILAFTAAHSLGAEFERALRKDDGGRLDSLFATMVRAVHLRRSFTFTAFLASLAIILFLLWRSAIPEARNLVFILLLLAFIFVFITLAAEAGGSHHIMMMYPFHLIVIAGAFCGGSEFIHRNWPGLPGRFGQAALGAGLAAVLFAAVIVNVVYLKSFQALGGRGAWSDAIYRLADYLKQRPEDQFVLMDWGFSSQLLVMDSSNINFREVYSRVSGFHTRKERIEAIYPYLLDPGNLFVFHTARFATVQLFQDFVEAVWYFGLELNLSKSFRQRDGREIYFVCSVKHPELDAYRSGGGYFKFAEAENFKGVSSGSVDFQIGASQQLVVRSTGIPGSKMTATCEWVLDRELPDSAATFRYLAGVLHDRVQGSIALDGKTAGTIVFEPGMRTGDVREWQSAKVPLGRLQPGNHRLMLSAIPEDQLLALDFLYIASEGFDYPLPPFSGVLSAGARAPAPNPEVVAFQENSNVKLEVTPREIRAGVDTLYLKVLNLDAPAIDLYYTLNGEVMPIVPDWKLNEDHSISVFVSKETPKGLYVYRAVRDSLTDSPMAWHRVDVPVLVR